MFLEGVLSLVKSFSHSHEHKKSVAYERIDLPDLSGYHVPDLSNARNGLSEVPAFGSVEYLKLKADLNPYPDCVPEFVNEHLTHDKPLVFADKAHESAYDREVREYVESLGDQAEPDTTDLGVCEPDKRFKLVGQGIPTSSHCGQFVGWMACSDIGNHNFTTLKGGNFAGKVDAHPVYHHCCRPSCPMCYSKGWSLREANIITQRMEAVEFGYTDSSGKKHAPMGRAEHIVISPPPSDYGLSYEKLKAKMIKVAMSRGIIGGVLVWHPKRYRKFDVIRGGIRNMRGWFFAPHAHIIGYFAPDINYDKCRKCPKMKAYEIVTGSGRVVSKIGNDTVCKGCCGFEAKVRLLAWGNNLKPNVDGSAGFYNLVVNGKSRKFQGDEYIVKVQEYRKSIFATAAYQLNHAGYMVGAKRFSPETWFGTMSYRKLEVTIERKKSLCRICNNELLPHLYKGHVLTEGFEAYADFCNVICDLVEHDSEGNSVVAWEIDKEAVKKPVYHSGA